MISSPLFIIVAESMVTFGPMVQVGWRSASSTVMRREGARVALAERAAAGGEHQPAHAVRALAAQALPERAVLAVDRQDARPARGRPGLDQLARHHQHLLGGGGDGPAGVERRQGRRQRGGAGDGHAHHVALHGGHLADGVLPGAHAGGDALARSAAPPRAARSTPKRSTTVGEAGDVAARDRADQLEALGEALDDVAALPADRAGGAEEDDPARGRRRGRAVSWSPPHSPRSPARAGPHPSEISR